MSDQPPGLLSECVVVSRKSSCSGKVGSLGLAFHFSTASPGTVGMWKSRCWRFPRAVGAVENLLLVFHGVHSPSFPRSFSCPAIPADRREQLVLGLLHLLCRLHIRLRSGLLVQFCDGNVHLQLPRQIREASQNLPRRGEPRVLLPDFPLSVITGSGTAHGR